MTYVYERRWDLEMNAITENIFLSGSTPLAYTYRIREAGIKLIICCCALSDVASEHGALKKAIPDLQIVYVPFEDDDFQNLFLPVEALTSNSAIPTSTADNIMDLLVSLVQNATSPVLIHCWAGISRSVSVVCYYLMVTRGLSYNEALAFVRSKREIACPNSGFADQLTEHER